MNENERDLFNVCCTGQSYPFNDFVTGLHRNYTHCQHKYCRTCLNKGCTFICPRCGQPFGKNTMEYLDRRLNPEKYQPKQTFNQLSSTPDYERYPDYKLYQKDQLPKTDEELYKQYLEKNCPKKGCSIQFGRKRRKLLTTLKRDLRLLIRI